MTDDRALSEVLGFVLVFALIVSTVLLVSLFGFGSLEDTRDAEELNNAVRAFDVLADNMADIHEEGAPSRATEISLQNAQLESGDQVTFNITGVNATGTSFPNIFNVEPIIFSSGDSAIVYSGGAVFRTSSNGGLMIREPPFLIGSDQVLLPIVQTQQRGSVTSTSGTTVRVRAENRQRRPVRGFNEAPSSFEKIIIQINSPRSDLWGEYLSEQEGVDNCEAGEPQSVRCTIDDPRSVYLSRSLIYYAFET